MCWDCMGYPKGDPYKDFVHGKVDPDDGWTETPHKSTKKKAKPKKKPGCPGNDGKAHVYVWTSEFEEKNFFYSYFGFHKYEKRVCVGCGVGSTKGRRVSERYVKKFKTQGRWSYAEDKIEAYREAKRDYINKHGWTAYLYN